MQLIFLSHPQVVVDPAVPVERWHLSQAGRAALQQFLERKIWPVPDMIWSSTETKAQETAALLGVYFNKTVQSHSALGENDRSATGFLPPAEFEQLADQFFAQPHHSLSGWERAVDAQARMCSVVSDIMDAAAKVQHKNIIICGHGQPAHCFIVRWPDCRFPAAMISPRRGIIGIMMTGQNRCCIIGGILMIAADRDYSLASRFMVL